MTRDPSSCSKCCACKFDAQCNLPTMACERNRYLQVIDDTAYMMQNGWIIHMCQKEMSTPGVGAFCGDDKGYWYGYDKDSGDMDAEGRIGFYTYGEGVVTIEFGNCGEEGTANLYHNFKQIAVAEHTERGADVQYQTVVIEYKNLDFVEIRDKNGHSIPNIKSVTFQCTSSDNVEYVPPKVEKQVEPSPKPKPQPVEETSADPCANVKCDKPETDCYASTGTCAEGKCTYALKASGESCTDGECDGSGTCVTKPKCVTKKTGAPPCVFPFKYSGTIYNTCTTKHYGTTHWCATGTKSATNLNMKGWGKCNMDTCEKEVKLGAESQMALNVSMQSLFMWAMLLVIFGGLGYYYGNRQKQKEEGKYQLLEKNVHSYGQKTNEMVRME